MAAPSALTYSYTQPPPPASGGVVCTATWNGSGTLTDTVTAGGSFVASFGGAILASVTTPLPGWAFGNPS